MDEILHFDNRYIRVNFINHIIIKIININFNLLDFCILLMIDHKTLTLT